MSFCNPTLRTGTIKAPEIHYDMRQRQSLNSSTILPIINNINTTARLTAEYFRSGLELEFWKMLGKPDLNHYFLRPARPFLLDLFKVLDDEIRFRQHIDNALQNDDFLNLMKSWFSRDDRNGRPQDERRPLYSPEFLKDFLRKKDPFLCQLFKKELLQLRDREFAT